MDRCFYMIPLLTIYGHFRELLFCSLHLRIPHSIADEVSFLFEFYLIFVDYLRYISLFLAFWLPTSLLCKCRNFLFCTRNIQSRNNNDVTKIALTTGSNKGIGFAIVKGLLGRLVNLNLTQRKG